MMEAMIREHRPKMYFTNTVLHNPTGASISQAVAYRVLKLAERFNLLIVEDDIYGDFHPSVMTRLATLDQLERVIYIGSFSKTISASLRVGFLACKGNIAENIADLKLLTGFTTSEIGERLVYQLLIDGYYRKHLDKLRGRLQIAREKAVCTLEKIGFVPYLEPEGGIFVWAKLPDMVDAADIASMASAKGVTLAPGGLFSPQQGSSRWFRFNVASFEDSLSSEVLSEIVLNLPHR
jgi:DNA-binding transcriptional MocR family regulator